MSEEKDKKLSVTLSTGVTIEGKHVSMFVLNEVTKDIVRPSIPKFFNQENGREEDNPSDPNYLEAMKRYNTETSDKWTDAVILLGSKVTSIPKGMQTPDDTEWLEDLKTLGINVDEGNKRARYIAWVKFVAAPSTEDVEKLMAMFGASSGVPEEEVDKATKSFRDDIERSSDTGNTETR